MSVTLLKHLSVGDRFSLGFQSKDGVQLPARWRLNKGIPIAHSLTPQVDQLSSDLLDMLGQDPPQITVVEAKEEVALTTDHSRGKTALPTPQTPAPSSPAHASWSQANLQAPHPGHQETSRLRTAGHGFLLTSGVTKPKEPSFQIVTAAPQQPPATVRSVLLLV